MGIGAGGRPLTQPARGAGAPHPFAILSSRSMFWSSAFSSNRAALKIAGEPATPTESAAVFLTMRCSRSANTQPFGAVAAEAVAVATRRAAAATDGLGGRPAVAQDCNAECCAAIVRRQLKRHKFGCAFPAWRIGEGCN